jgi:diguanylate cyclase (GGDEF)-like protein
MEIFRRRILIADDNKDIHDDIKYILETSSISTEEYQEAELLKKELFGEKDTAADQNEALIDIRYSIDDAYQGNEAVEMVRRARESGNPYSLVFMDVRMPPGMDGIETIEDIWKIDPDIGVVICTAYSDYSWNQIVTKLGQNDNLLFIRKPFDHVSLKQIALAMTTKWSLKMQVKAHIENLENQVALRTNELTRTVRKLKKEIALREEKEKQLAYSAHYDMLTDLLNRRSFYTSLAELAKNGECRRDKFSLFYIDLDDFKSVNDLYGHDIGDKLLAEVAVRIGSELDQHACMIPDYVSSDGKVKAIFRLGGDEFVAFVNEAEREKVGEIAQKLIDMIKEPYFISNHELDISCSIGISVYKDGSVPADMLLKYADIALYEAKRIHGVYRFHESSHAFIHLNEIRIEKELKKAIERNQIEVYLQSLVDTNEKIVGIQALMRWLHPEYGELEASQFLHIAQKSDQIILLGRHVLRKALAYLRKVHEAGYRDLFIMITCTAKEFYHPDFVSNIKSVLSETGIEPRYLKLNLEDKFSFQAAQNALSIIRELSELGVRFAVNGFASAYPVFAFLQQMPNDTMIKLNKAYVHNIVTDKRKREFLLSLIDIISTWDLKIIISGIETREQKQLLDSKRCILQGYHFNIPKPFEHYLEDLRRGV